MMTEKRSQKRGPTAGEKSRHPTGGKGHVQKNVNSIANCRHELYMEDLAVA